MKANRQTYPNTKRSLGSVYQDFKRIYSIEHTYTIAYPKLLKKVAQIVPVTPTAIKRFQDLRNWHKVREGRQGKHI
ncbi:hypothetical protein CEN45_07385 [Fischerella thermalis CCMEE 5198]|uniref:hypothetical protein n=1 Tax=Fischerella thermalis TaxID=372787 RepID=UPI000C80A4FC|nr:hypothetical protein [Fischerella thermalis]PLZ84592.1 hypothetical protein CI594_23850 [Fischerella thermalis CCMEE 5196]PMB24773.1 hypothetical protein CEN45_07385 [Fischerella thermalis CCMEE 5198]